MKDKTSVFVLAITLMFSLPALAGDWPHWRGPSFDGSSGETNLPATFSKTENVAWTAALPGPSSATPIIVGGKVFINSAEKDSDDLFALCFDAATGKKLWQTKVASSDRVVMRNNLATCSPAVDAKNVYFLYGAGTLAALDHKGKIVWSRNIETEYGNISEKYGYSSSPLLYDGKLFIPVLRRPRAYREPKEDNLDSFMLAIDVATGKNVWKQNRPSDTIEESFDAYTSPILFDNSGRKEILHAGADYITSNDPATGKELWRYKYRDAVQDRWRLVSNVLAGEGLIFGAKPRGSGVYAIKPYRSGNVPEDHLVWTFKEPAPDCTTPACYNGNLYVLDGMRARMVTCLDAKTGQQKWQGQLPDDDPYFASITAADGKLYCVSNGGLVVVLSAGDSEFKIISQAEFGEGPVVSAVAVADEHLFIRTAENLYCIGK